MVAMKYIKEFIVHFNTKFHASNRNLSLMLSIKLSFFLSYSDLFLHNHIRCGRLLLNLITLNDTHKHTHMR